MKLSFSDPRLLQIAFVQPWPWTVTQWFDSLKLALPVKSLGEDPLNALVRAFDCCRTKRSTFHLLNRIRANGSILYHVRPSASI